MTPMRKLAATAALFAVGLGMVAMAAALKDVAPLFLAWIPLLLVGLVLTRPEPVSGPPPAENRDSRTPPAGTD
jgi:hypothetical protein